MLIVIVYVTSCLTVYAIQIYLPILQYMLAIAGPVVLRDAQRYVQSVSE